MTPEQQIAALRRWPRILALTLTGNPKPTVTWKQFCEAQDQYEAAITSLIGPITRDKGGYHG
jgi:hypothetical protein